VHRVALVVLMLVASGQALAETATQSAQKAAAAEKKLSQTRAQIKVLADQQRKLDNERGAATKALREVDGKVSEAQRALRKTDEQIAAQEMALEKLRQQKLAIENSLSRQRAELAALVRSAYALGKNEQLKLLLEQDRVSDLARVLAYHRYFQKDRQQRIVGLNAELQSLAQVATEIEDKQKDLLAAREKQQAELSAVADQRRQRSKLVSSLDGSYKNSKARMNALGRDEKRTAAMLERLRKLMAQLAKPPPVKPGIRPGPKPGAAIPLGSLRLPITGTILAGYGGTMPDGHPSQGLLIAGAAGAEVHAVSAGRVAYADWLKGYGLLIILDHGGGWMTLYAFNDTLLKNVGDPVTVGEAISTVGSSGGQGRSALYFELRRNGQPTDPRSWLKK
jgi:septal ring factor EnvC (AmiA/AmiB activator)